MYEAFYLSEKNLVDLISKMEQYRWLFVRNPVTDFTRVKKWSFSETLKFMITMQGNSLKTELYNYFDFGDDIPTNSSFNQRCAQILPEALEFLFKEFTRTLGQKQYRGYRLLACDGSNLYIAHNPDDKSTYSQSLPTSKGYNQLHLNTLYDLMSHTYTDAIIQPVCQENENKAMCDMIDQYSNKKKTIFIADRLTISIDNMMAMIMLRCSDIKVQLPWEKDE